MMPEDSSQMDWMHAGRLGEIGHMERVGAAIVKHVARRLEPTWWSAFVRFSCARRSRGEKRGGVVFDLEQCAGIPGSAFASDRLREREAGGLVEQRSALRQPISECQKMRHVRRDGECEKAALEQRRSRFEVIAMGGAGRIEDERRQVADGWRTGGSGHVQAIEHEDEVRVLVRVSFDDAMRVGVHDGELDAVRLPSRFGLPVERSEGEHRGSMRRCHRRFRKLRRYNPPEGRTREIGKEFRSRVEWTKENA